MTANNPADGADDPDDTVTLTADNIVTPREYDPTKMGSPNETDYDFPAAWGLYTQEQRNRWFAQERAKRRDNRSEKTSHPQDTCIRPADKDYLWRDWSGIE